MRASGCCGAGGGGLILVLATWAAQQVTTTAFDADSGSRSDGETSKIVPYQDSQGRTLFLPLKLLALWKLRPYLASFSGGIQGYGSFAYPGGIGTFGGYFGQQPFYPGGYPGFFPGGVAAGAQAGVGGIYPGGFHPIGYPFPVVGGPVGQQNNKLAAYQNRIKPLRPFVRPNNYIPQFDLRDPSRLDSTEPPENLVEDEEEDSTSQPGLVQTLRELASPLFHEGQRVEARRL